MFDLWYTTLTAGAGAISVPVIIHLLNRRRYRVVTWAAMRFLLAAQRQNTRRMRIEQLLLLLVRMLLIASILFAMSSVMPWAEALWTKVWPGGLGQVAARTQRAHHLLVLDCSLSMNALVQERPAFEHARALAIQKVQSCPSGDGFSVLLLKDNPVWLIGEVSQDGRKVVRELEAVRPSHGNGTVSTSLTMVAAKLGEAARRFPVQAVYFFTDLQQTTWQGPLTSELPIETDGKDRAPHLDIQQLASTYLVDVGRDGIGNVGILDLGFRLDAGSPFLISNTPLSAEATVRNFSSEPKKNLRVELLIGKAKEAAGESGLALRVADQALVDQLAAGESRPVSFANVKFPAPGTYVVQARMEGDALELDNSRAIVVTVRETIPVLLVNGKTAADRYDRATEYLRLVLNPFPAGSEPKYAPLRPKVIPQAQFSDMTEAELAPYDCIYWCDVGNFGPADLRRVEGHLRRGGGFIVSAGENTAQHLDVYNRLLAKDEGLLPARLVRKVTAPAEHTFYLHADEAAYLELPLKAFKDELDRNSLRNARFKSYLQVQGQENKGRTFLTFMPMALDAKVKSEESLPKNDPAWIEWNPPLPRAGAESVAGPGSRGQARYRGKVVLCTTTLNMDWTSWPGSPSYGAMMHETARLAAAGRLREQAANVGGVLEEVFPSGAELEVTLQFPEGSPGLKPARLKTQLVDDANVFRWADTDVSGIYRLQAGTQEIPFAVNVPAASSDLRGSESDLTRLPADKIAEMYSGWNATVVHDARGVTLATAGGQQVVEEERSPVGPLLANLALLLALVLAIAEIVLAWQFGHYTHVAGTVEQPATGLLWPSLIAVTTTVLFAVGAVIVFHAYSTGDFLGFLPEVLRTAGERFLNVPPPPPGENTHWELEPQTYLFGLVANERWLSAFLAFAAAALVFAAYRAEAPQVNRIYKVLLGSLRVCLVLLLVWVLLPRLQLRFDREGWPDLVVLIDDSRSMGEADVYQDPQLAERSKALGDSIRQKLAAEVPAKIQSLQAQLAAKAEEARTNADAKLDAEALTQRLQYWEKQQDLLPSMRWRPTRLQLAQALIENGGQDWLSTLVQTKRVKLHLYHLDINGRATRLADDDGAAGEILDNSDPRALERANRALARLEPEGRDSRLGVALRQVLDQYRGTGLAGVVMLTDGVTTREETIGQLAEHAARKGVPLFLVGLGDAHEIRDLKLHDLQCEDVVFIHDNMLFEAKLTGHGYKDLEVPIVLKIREASGAEKEVERTKVRVDPTGKSVKVRLRHQATKVGRFPFIIEVEPPKVDGVEKPVAANNLRLERTIEVVDAKMIKVLYVEGQPRYEFRYLKYLLEREIADAKKGRSIELKVVLLDADDDFAAQDRTALADFPATLEELNQYDVVVFGDCDPRHKKLGDQRLKNLANFVRGEDDKGRKLSKPGGGLLLIAGAFHTPHALKDTPLAEVMPIEPLVNRVPAEPSNRADRLRPELTPVGRMHPIFRFSPDESESMNIWMRLAPMYFYATKYRVKPLAEVLAVHPTEPAAVRQPNQDGRHPLMVQQFVGTGRAMFFAFDESWRWSLREDEGRYNNFWIQTMRYLSRGRSTRTDLRLDRQTPYRVGEPIKVTVRFPDNSPGGPADVVKLGKSDVKVTVEFRPGSDRDTPGEPEVQTMQLTKVEGSWGTYESTLARTRDGKYRFRLINPDVSKTQPDGEKPTADATVELPPGELDKLRMSEAELRLAAEASSGRFYTLANAERLLEDLPTGVRVSLSAPTAPLLLWNHYLLFATVMFLLSSEWILRKRKHML